MFKKIKIDKSKGAFTLMELIVAIAMIAILSTVVITNFRNANRVKSVQLASDLVSNALTTARNEALSGYQIPNSNCAQKEGVAFIVSINAGLGLITVSALDSCNNSWALSNYNFSSDVEITPGNSIVVNGGGDPGVGNTMKIKFVPPFAKSTMSRDGGSYSDFGSITIPIQTTDGRTTRNVTFDGISGRINTQ